MRLRRGAPTIRGVLTGRLGTHEAVLAALDDLDALLEIAQDAIEALEVVEPQPELRGPSFDQIVGSSDEQEPE